MKRILIILLILTAYSSAFAKYIVVDIDGCLFSHDENHKRLELYYSIPDTSFKFIPADEAYIGQMYFRISLSNAVGEEIIDEWVVTIPAEKPITDFSMNFIGGRNFLLKPDQYKATLTIKDPNDTSTYAETSFPVLVKNPDRNKIEISQMELASIIRYPITDTMNINKRFVKNGIYVVPNPRFEYFGKQPKFHAYSEIYNAKNISPDGILIEYTVLDAINSVILHTVKQKSTPYNAIVETVSLPLDSIASGVYFIRQKVKYPPANPIDSVQQIRKFYIINPDMPPSLDVRFFESESFESSEFSTLNDSEIEVEFRKARTIATPYEAQLYEECKTLECKQRFMFGFWLRRDPDTLTRNNEALMDYRRRIEYANTYYAYGKLKDGWKTDRGRVLLEYGYPTQVDYHPRNASDRPYEEWFYGEQQGGVRFIFVDVEGYGNLRLVHSNAVGEISEPNWMDYYVKNVKYKGPEDY